MDAGFTAATFGAQLLTAAQGALPFIAGGTAGGVVVLAAMWGLGLGIKALRKVGK